MPSARSIAQQLEAQSVVWMESSIPVGMTIEQWRRQRPASSRPRRRRSARTVAQARHLAPVPEPAPCDHLCDTTTRYDAAQKLLSFLLVCPTCGAEKLIDTVRYEPRFEPHPTAEPAAATIDQLSTRRRRRPTPRAA